MAENGRTSSGYNFEQELGNRGKSKYLVSQLLSSSFKRNGWDGIFIPGVHGSQGRHYHNCTIFSTIVDQWKDWASGSYFQKKNEKVMHEFKLPNNGMNSDFKMLAHFKTGYPKR